MAGTNFRNIAGIVVTISIFATGLSVVLLREMKSYRISGDRIDAHQWNDFITHSPQGCLYAIYEYISIIRPDWEAIIVEQNEEWKAVMPFCINKKGGYQSIPQPMLTQHWGIFMVPEANLPLRKSLSNAEAYISEIVPHFDDIDLFTQNFSPQFTYPLPFHWQGYELSVRYTYHLKLNQSESELFAQISAPLRRQIKKAQNRDYSIFNCEDTQDLERLFEL
ncbi:MAG: hypothetical protein KDD63_15725, partial [Bacteroidetes bacterium]|nr:hypothetical protein [Bacteroidota bacterium]